MADLQKGDRVRVTFEAEVRSSSSTVGGDLRVSHPVQSGYGLRVKLDQVELIEKAENPERDAAAVFRHGKAFGEDVVYVKTSDAPNVTAPWFLVQGNRNINLVWRSNRLMDGFKIIEGQMIPPETPAAPGIQVIVDGDDDRWFELVPGKFTWAGYNGSRSRAERRRAENSDPDLVDRTREGIADQWHIEREYRELEA